MNLNENNGISEDVSYSCPSCSTRVKEGTIKCEGCWTDTTDYVACMSCGTTLNKKKYPVCPECFCKNPKYSGEEFRSESKSMDESENGKK